MLLSSRQQLHLHAIPDLTECHCRVLNVSRLAVAKSCAVSILSEEPVQDLYAGASRAYTL